MRKETALTIEAKVRITALTAKGYSAGQTIARLNAEGITTPTGRSWNHYRLRSFARYYKITIPSVTKAKNIKRASLPVGYNHSERIAEMVMDAPYSTSKKLNLIAAIQG